MGIAIMIFLFRRRFESSSSSSVSSSESSQLGVEVAVTTACRRKMTGLSLEAPEVEVGSGLGILVAVNTPVRGEVVCGDEVGLEASTCFVVLQDEVSGLAAIGAGACDQMPLLTMPSPRLMLFLSFGVQLLRSRIQQ